MKILINNIKDLLEEKLSIEQRGLMITAILLKDDDSKLTLAKFKAKVSMKAHKENLIYLHNHKFIKWSGYNNAVKSLERLKVSPDIHEVIGFMNKLYKRKFNPDSENTISNLRNRLESYSVDEVKLVVANRWEAWKDSAEMSKHLNPTTIFRPSKFDKYFEEVNRTHQGEALLSAERANLKHGEVLDEQDIEGLIDNDIYSIKTYVKDKGSRVGNGIPQKVYGRNLKRLLKTQVKKDDLKQDFTYVYQGE